MSTNFEQTSFLFGSNSVFIEELYQKYIDDPSSIDPSWIEFFREQVEFAPLKSTSKIIMRRQDKVIANVQSKKSSKNTLNVERTSAENSLRAKFMIMAYREHGHHLADLDPLNLEVKKTRAELKLNLEDFGFSVDHLEDQVDLTGELSDITICKIGELRDILERTYSGSLAVEFSHVENTEEQRWLYEQLEGANTHIMFSNDEKKSNSLFSYFLNFF